MQKYIIGAASTLLILSLGVGAYYLGTQKSTSTQKEIIKNTEQTSKTEKNLPTTEPSLTTEPSPTSQSQSQSQSTIHVTEQIVAAITIKNTQPLEGYMADTVEVRLESSGCCGLITKAEAMSQLSYLDPAVGWSFDPTNPIIVDLAINVPNYYGSDWIVGVASNEYIVSFKLNSQDKIEAYNLGASYKLLIP